MIRDKVYCLETYFPHENQHKTPICVQLTRSGRAARHPAVLQFRLEVIRCLVERYRFVAAEMLALRQ